jgi:pimeloyl-ACP methyl ester carboxylesterase
MPAFFVHGVPDTAQLWDPIRAHLSRTDIVAHNLPGFDAAPLPDGFGATNNEYADWLIARIEEIGERVDIVGHDWGSRLVQRIVFLRPDLIRTWTCGGAPNDPEYVWHPTAQIWQTPGAGEELMQNLTSDAMTAALAPQGLGEEAARAVASRIDDTMKDCILKLYRSAKDVSHDWPPLEGDYGPGLSIWGAEDPYSSPEFGRKIAQRTGARSVTLEGCKHWWPVERPKEVAALLEELWAGAG